MRDFPLVVVIGVAVAFLATLLLTIGARSPFTHGNLLRQYDSTYTRTEQSVVGERAPYHGSGTAALSQPAAEPQEQGRALLVSHGCAACHGLEGRGAAVGPPIIGFDAADFRAKVEKGPGGMPAYGSVSDEDLDLIARYLKSLAGRAGVQRSAESP